jgi:hypothetical protein
MIHAFVTNQRGPDAHLRMAGCPITGTIPVTATSGNVTVSFAALSYDGTLCLTVNSDPQWCPDVVLLEAALRR